jgi:hypothetical protein
MPVWTPFSRCSAEVETLTGAPYIEATIPLPNRSIPRGHQQSLGR